MKKLIVSVLVALMLGTPSYCEVIKKGNTYINVTQSRKTKELVATPYKYVPNSKKPNEVYTVYINANNGACYIKRVSKTTGNQRDERIKDEEMCKNIAKAMGIEYTYKPRNKK